MSVVTEALRETGSSLGMVFRNPALRKLNLAFAGSAVGDWAYATAMAVWVYSVGGVTAVGIWGTARLVIMTVVTPFASILVDRYSRKRIMVTADLLRGGVIFVCAFLVMTDAPAWTVFVLATLTSVFAAPFRPAVAALLPHLVERPEELTAANGTSSTIDSLSFFVGPALGGILLTFTTVPVVMLINVATFVWSAALVASIRVPHPTAEAERAVTAPSTSDVSGSRRRRRRRRRHAGRGRRGGEGDVPAGVGGRVPDHLAQQRPAPRVARLLRADHRGGGVGRLRHRDGRGDDQLRTERRRLPRQHVRGRRDRRRARRDSGARRR